MLLLNSYQQWLGKPLLEAAERKPAELAQRIFEAPFAVLSHTVAADPIFNYANRTAMQLFELDWAGLTQLPSRKSAEPMNRAERARLLETVARQNYIDDYAGIRISATGRRFLFPAPWSGSWQMKRVPTAVKRPRSRVGIFCERR